MIRPVDAKEFFSGFKPIDMSSKLENAPKFFSEYNLTSRVNTNISPLVVPFDSITKDVFIKSSQIPEIMYN